jgi:hypothetical protein
MVTYEVTCEIEPAQLAVYEPFMRERHIPDLLATGCFEAAELLQAAPGRYRVRYHAKSQTDLDRYLADHAPRFRAEFQGLLPAGVKLSRETWVEIQRWEVQAPSRMASDRSRP